MTPRTLYLASSLALLLLLASCGQDEPVTVPPPVAPQDSAEAQVAAAEVTELIEVPGGIYRPMFPGKDEPKEAQVPGFRIDEHAVTNAQFAEFVTASPQWQRGAVDVLFADSGYLRHWESATDPGKGVGDRPVVHVSWHAARAYADWVGKRLPTLAEWEYVAAAGETEPEGAQEEGFHQRILDWYAQPAGDGPAPVGSAFRNLWGVADMHGLVWEWVEDFNTALVTGESRGDSGLDRGLFCGSGSIGSADPSDYAAFMRFAFRGSLQADYATATLGFRCAVDSAPVRPCCRERMAAGLPAGSIYHLGSVWRDQSGAERKLDSFQGRVQIAAMIFTHCSYACPLLMLDLQKIEAGMPEELRAQVSFLLISFDHVRDTPEALADYAAREGLDLERWTLLHGDASQVRETAAALGVRYKQTETGDFSHSNLITVLDRQGRVVHRQEGLGGPPDETLVALRAAVGEE